jgi:hypothetical protein
MASGVCARDAISADAQAERCHALWDALREIFEADWGLAQAMLISYAVVRWWLGYPARRCSALRVPGLPLQAGVEWAWDVAVQACPRCALCHPVLSQPFPFYSIWLDALASGIARCSCTLTTWAKLTAVALRWHSTRIALWSVRHAARTDYSTSKCPEGDVAQVSGITVRQFLQATTSVRVRWRSRRQRDAVVGH